MIVERRPHEQYTVKLDGSGRVSVRTRQHLRPFFLPFSTGPRTLEQNGWTSLPASKPPEDGQWSPQLPHSFPEPPPRQPQPASEPFELSEVARALPSSPPRQIPLQVAVSPPPSSPDVLPLLGMPPQSPTPSSRPPVTDAAPSSRRGRPPRRPPIVPPLPLPTQVDDSATEAPRRSGRATREPRRFSPSP